MTVQQRIGAYQIDGNQDGVLHIEHVPTGSTVTINDGDIEAGAATLSQALFMSAEDLTGVAGEQGEFRVHDGTDGTNANAAGLARHNGTDWISQVDGGTIA